MNPRRWRGGTLRFSLSSASPRLCGYIRKIKTDPLPPFPEKYGYMEKLLIFTTNPAIMKLIRLTALSSLLFLLLTGLNSCEKDAEQKKTTDFSKSGIVLSYAQEFPTPPVFSAAIGSMDVYYTRETRILTYTVTWSGLTGPVALMHIHGLAPTGYPAGVVQNIITPSGGIVTPSNTLYPATGKFSGSLLIDGVLVKEQDLLNGLYYMNIHTASNPGGEIRGQIRFQ